MYINQGRFGEFVQKFFEGEYEKKKNKAEEEKEWKLWVAYIHSYSDENFQDWKNRIAQANRQNANTGNDQNLDDDGIASIINNLFP